MAPRTIRKAIGTVKDQTSKGIAKVASNLAPDLEVAIVKATSHDDEPANEKHLREILNFTSLSRGYVHACVAAVSKRLGKTRDWIVALKSLALVHRLLADGDPLFQEEILYATRRGARLLNMSDFRDEAHSSSWDHSAFVRTYAMYLDQRLEMILFERKAGIAGPPGAGAGGSSHGGEYSGGRGDFRSPPPRTYEYNDYGDYRREGEGSVGGYGPPRRTRSFGDMNEAGGGRDERAIVAVAVAVTPLRDMKPEKIFGKMGHLQRLLDRFLSCRPTGLAKSSRLVLIALYPVVKESFQLYADVCEVLAVLLDKFFDMEYPDCVKAFDTYASAAKQIDELIQFYNWCKDTGVARSGEYPEVQRITGKLLEILEEFLRDRAKRGKSPDRKVEEKNEVVEEEPVPDMNEIKALPAPESYAPPPPPEPEPKPQQPQFTEDLVNLREDAASADDQGNRLALALFNGPADGNGSWEAFSSDGKTKVTSAWQNPAAEQGKADWELALVETASNLAKQKADLAGGFDSLLLNGMYDQGVVRQHVSTAQLSGGSASSVALPGPRKSATPVLALPAPDGTVQTFNHDPFAASLVIPPPSYVQMADMEKKQHLLVQEQMVWQQYAREGMQGQASLAKVNGVLPIADSPVVDRKYTYSRGRNSYPTEAVDVHEVVVRKRRTATPVLLACLLAICHAFYYLFISQKASLSGLFYRLIYSVIFMKTLFRKAVTKESVVVMPTFGVQLETHYSSGQVIRRFVPVSKILKPALVECVTPVTCYWSLSLILQDESDLTLVFKELRPPLKMLVPVWKALCIASSDPVSSDASVEGSLRHQKSSKVV